MHWEEGGGCFCTRKIENVPPKIESLPKFIEKIPPVLYAYYRKYR